MLILIILFVSHVIVMLAHTAGLALAGRLAGASFSEIGIFTGPTLLSASIRGVTFHLKLLPLGSYVKFDEVAPGYGRPRRGKLFQDLHPLTRALIATAGCLALLLIAIICLGPSTAFRQTVSGFPQIVAGALHPATYGAQLLQLLYEFVSANPLLVTLGLVASKEAAFNLLPLPVLNGGDIILNLIGFVKPIPDSVKSKVNMFGFLLLLAIWACWLLALIFSFTYSRMR